MGISLVGKKKLRFLRCLLFASVFAFVLVMNAKAEETRRTDLSIKLPDTIENGTPFNVTVEVDADLPVAMAQFEVIYDETHLQLVNIETGTFLVGGPTVNGEIPGHIFFVWESLAPVESAGDWLVCTFISNTNETPSVDVEKNDDLIFGSPDLEMMEVNVSKELISSTEQRQNDEDNQEGTNNGINLKKNKQKITAGTEATLLVEDNNSENLLWETSNAAVATVSGGKIEAHQNGTAVITVTNEDETKSATCIVTVENDAQDYSAESAAPDQEKIEQNSIVQVSENNNAILYRVGFAGIALVLLTFFILAYLLLHKKK